MLIFFLNLKNSICTFLLSFNITIITNVLLFTFIDINLKFIRKILKEKIKKLQITKL